ncbi:MAG: hypothetical protein N3F08_04305 [Crenarchaeota archaeon]|nr:hypothetical protein [Thermoproteota archaeon]
MVRLDYLGIMHLKGFKYIPTILHTGNFIALKPSEYMYPIFPLKIDLPLSYFEEIDRIFNLLKRKVNIRTRRHEAGGAKTAAMWSNEVLNFKVIQADL